MLVARRLLALLAVLVSGCPSSGGGADATDTSTFDCGARLVALARAPGGAYAPLTDVDGDAELVLGFQGFRYVYVRGHLDADPGPIAAAAVLQLDGGPPRSQPLLLTFAPDPTGVISAPVQLYFNDDPLPALVDHGLAIELRLGTRCVAGGHTVLRYDPTCVEGPDGQPVCAGPDGAPDGGP